LVGKEGDDGFGGGDFEVGAVEKDVVGGFELGVGGGDAGEEASSSAATSFSCSPGMVRRSIFIRQWSG
jgi:hypothetical protein